MHILIVFGYWDRMEFIHKLCLIKTLCSVGNWRIDDEEVIGNVQMDAKSKKAMHFISLLKQYEELALTAHHAGSLLGREQILPGSMAKEI